MTVRWMRRVLGFILLIALLLVAPMSMDSALASSGDQVCSTTTTTPIVTYDPVTSPALDAASSWACENSNARSVIEPSGPVVAAEVVISAPGGPTVDFAHGTTSGAARSIVDDGLSEAAGAASTAGGRYARPGSFHTFGVTPSDTRGLQLAYEMGLRHGDDVCVVICRLPASTYDDLVRQGHVVVEPIPGASVPQTVFRLGAFPTINRDAIWQTLKPGGG